MLRGIQIGTLRFMLRSTTTHINDNHFHFHQLSSDNGTIFSIHCIKLISDAFQDFFNFSGCAKDHIEKSIIEFCVDFACELYDLNALEP